jgi:hypothetical protein
VSLVCVFVHAGTRTVIWLSSGAVCARFKGACVTCVCFCAGRSQKYDMAAWLGDERKVFPPQKGRASLRGIFVQADTKTVNRLSGWVMSARFSPCERGVRHSVVLLCR